MALCKIYTAILKDLMALCKYYNLLITKGLLALAPAQDQAIS